MKTYFPPYALVIFVLIHIFTLIYLIYIRK